MQQPFNEHQMAAILEKKGIYLCENGNVAFDQEATEGYTMMRANGHDLFSNHAKIIYLATVAKRIFVPTRAYGMHSAHVRQILEAQLGGNYDNYVSNGEATAALTWAGFNVRPRINDISCDIRCRSLVTDVDGSSDSTADECDSGHE